LYIINKLALNTDQWRILKTKKRIRKCPNKSPYLSSIRTSGIKTKIKTRRICPLIKMISLKDNLMLKRFIKKRKV